MRWIINQMKQTRFFFACGILLVLAACQTATNTAINSEASADNWAGAARVLERIQAPTFPDRDFNITDFGAQVDSDSTVAIRAAIDACHEAGGGRVIIPEGRWLTGALFLRSNVNLHLNEGATLEWTFNLDAYPLVFTRWEGIECMNFSPLIYAYEQENIAITGKGTLDGGGSNETWWLWNPKDKSLITGKHSIQHEDRLALIEMGKNSVPVEERVFGKGHYLRPNFIQPYKCKNILIEGVTILRSPMWEIHPVLSQNITVRGVTITTHGPNNDGCDPESCSDVLIENCLFDTGDDCIAIKSGRNNDGRRVNVPSENIIVRNCMMKDGHGGVVLGSECSGHIRNVWVENCRMDSPNLDRALRFKDNAVRGGILENVFMRDVQVGQVREAVLTIDLLYEEGSKGDHPPIVRNVQLERITSSSSPRVMFIRGFEGATIDHIRISDSTFSGITHTEVLEYADSIQFDHVTMIPATNTKSRNTVASPPKATATATLPDGSPISSWFQNTDRVEIGELGRRVLITDFGAVSGGTTLNTKAIQQAIDKAADQGGGIVVVPEGRYLTGALYFKPGTHLYIKDGGVLLGSDNIADFPVSPSRMEGQNLNYYSAVVNADGLDGFTISGKGTIDGNGLNYWKAFWARRDENPDCTNLEVARPRLIFIRNSNNVQLQDVTLKDSGFWTTHLYKCSFVKLLNLHITSPSSPVKAPSTDAIDLDVCSNVLIDGCYLSVNDDAIALKGGKGPWADDDPNNGPNTHIIIQNSTFGFCHAALCFGSESIYDRNIVMRNCKMDGAARVLRLKMRPDTPQTYEHVLIDGLTGTADRFMFIKPWTQFFDLQGREEVPESTGRHFEFRNIDLQCRIFADMALTEYDHLADFSFSNLNIIAVDGNLDPALFDGLKLNNVKVNGQLLNAEK